MAWKRNEYEYSSVSLPPNPLPARQLIFFSGAWRENPWREHLSPPKVQSVTRKGGGEKGPRRGYSLGWIELECGTGGRGGRERGEGDGFEESENGARSREDRSFGWNARNWRERTIRNRSGTGKEGESGRERERESERVGEEKEPRKRMIETSKELQENERRRRSLAGGRVVVSPTLPAPPLDSLHSGSFRI